MRKLLAWTLALACLAGCAGQRQGQEAPPEPEAVEDTEGMEDVKDTEDVEGVDLAASVTARPVEGAEVTEDMALAATGFGLDLFKASLTGENPLVSPLSVMEALAMTAGGAAGDTLAQMESAFGGDIQAVNDFLLAYRESLGQGAAVANGIWLNQDAGAAVKEDFLQTNADYYGASVTERPFDGGARDEINGWVKDHTAGRIESILDELDPAAALVLVNALVFDGAWEDVYREDQVRDGTFTNAAGESETASFMWSLEDMLLKDEHAAGFIKPYEGRDYAFAALLPEEGMTVEEYAESLTAEGLRKLLTEPAAEPVSAALPKFEARWGGELSGALADMGMADLFDPAKADLSNMADGAAGPLYVSQVQHRTFIRVDEKGTQAGAATAVEVRAAGAMDHMEEVVLDRPFLYVLMDGESRVPLFIGAVTDLG